MEVRAIKQKFENAIRKIYSNDYYLLKNKLNERAVSPCLFCYLRPEFPDYNVDHEYNGNIENTVNGRKQMVGSESEFRQFDKIRKPKIIDGMTVSNIVPDIIVHKRGFNTDNLLVIEVKLAKSKQFAKLNLHDRFDTTKLHYFTGRSSGFNFKLGAFLQLGIDKYCTSYFVEGIELLELKNIKLM